MEVEQTSIYARNGTVSFKGEPAIKEKTGKWAGAIPMLVIQTSVTVIFFGIVANLVTYLTNVLHRSVVQSARDVNNFQGTYFISSAVAGFMSDTYWGRYRTMLCSFLLFCVGLSGLTISASLKALRPPSCVAQSDSCEQPTPAQSALFFFSLYATAFAGGTATTSLVSFGADQFDESDESERHQRYSFFNFIVCAINAGGLMSVTILVYVEDHVGWSWGFGMLLIVLSVTVATFLVQTPTYRYRTPEGSPLTKIVQVLAAAFRKRNVVASLELYEEQSIARGKRHIPHTKQFTFLDKAAVRLDRECDDNESATSSSPWKLSTVTRVEEVKLVIRMLPVWLATLWFASAPSQAGTFFLRQGMAMDNRLGNTTFKVPPATMLLFSNLAAILSLLVYDRLLVPLLRKLTRNERGISLLQRIGVGIFISAIAIAVAALLEIKRKSSSSSSRLTIFWLVPQYTVIGIAEGLASTALLDFFSEQSPDTFHSLGVSLALTNLGVGSFLSSVLISCVNRAAPSWLQNDADRGHLDYFYWLVAGLSIVNLVIYVPLASWYSYKTAGAYGEIEDEPKNQA